MKSLKRKCRRYRCPPEAEESAVSGADDQKMERTTLLLLLLLGLAVSCRAQFAPPTVNISLDEDPAVRWMPLAKVFDIDYVNKAAVEVIE